MAITSLMAPAWAHAQGLPASTPAQQTDDNGVESARIAARSAAVWLASGIDSWFGNKPFSDGGKVSDGQLGLSYYSRQDDGGSHSIRFNARFQLPNLEARTYLFTGRDYWQGQITDKPAAFATKQRLLQSDTAEEQSFIAGIGRFVNEASDVRIGFKEGLTLFAQARYRHRWHTASDAAFEFSETVFLTTADRLGSSTALSYQHQFSSVLVARWLNTLTVTQTDPDAEWNGSLGFHRSMGQQKQLSLELLAKSKQRTGLGLSDYGVQVRWEQPVDHDRLMGELIVGHFWPKTGDRSTAWALGAGLKMSF
ncbi:MAG: hypothetical protein K9K38_06000 [Rhodoferax sp.]|nr:hypothetical protein [Rhodoferax sp.]